MSFLTHLAQTYEYTADTSEQLFVDPTPAESAMNVALFLLPLTIILVIAYVVSALLLGRIFKKAGIESWKAWVPFYNIWLTYKLGDQPGWWTIITVIPIINIVPAIILLVAQYKIGLKFGKSGAFVLWAIFFPIVWYIWLAFDDSTWQSNNAVATPAPAPAFVPPANPTI